MLEVAILSYNRPVELSRVLKSLPTGFESDVIYTIFDDKSPDINKIIDEYKKFSLSLPNLRLVHREENLGYDKNLYQALIQSNAEYVVLISDDDFFETSSLEFLIRQHKTFSSSLYIFPYSYKNRIFRRYQSQAPSDIASLIYNSILFSGLCFRTDRVKSVPRIESMFSSVYIQVYLYF